MNRAMWAGTIMAVVMGAAATAAPARADDWSKTYQISGKATLEVTTDDGDVSIVSADQKQIDAHVITQGWKISSDEVRIEESQNGDNVRLNVKLPHFNWGIFGGRHRSVRVELRVPRELNLDIRTGDGNVSAQPVAGRIKIDTGDGNVTANGLRGEIRMHSGDGHIEASNLDGSLDVNTGDGRISVRGRFDTLNLNTGDGSIEAEAASGSNIASSWTLHSGDGHINLRIPENFKADVNAHTGDGHITLDVPISVAGSLSHSSIRGKLNGGGGALNISSGDGSIHVEKL
ncbi:MAG: DUF4097 family beta strand repeat-containing protein [Candidatus Acidiferrales bacterium]